MPTAAAALARLCDPLAEVSAHYLIDEDGALTQLVEESRRVWHAGQSFWQGETDLNSASIGIELVNPGHEFGYRSFPAAQITALTKLMTEIVARHGLDPKIAPLAHSDIAPLRKQDPGELFPWKDLAQQGLGLWPVPATEDYAPFDEADVQVLSEALGYGPSLLAFQRRYHPENLTGIADRETVARLRALKKLLKL
ncbi:MAG: N-acetylmuramoyl-L-alanine amidase [Alphaproteobacteria bacterium]|nr:N-acetylmuramoyl-L-alanine amidase [Alphaproteobacteria bacterium]